MSRGISERGYIIQNMMFIMLYLKGQKTTIKMYNIV